MNKCVVPTVLAVAGLNAHDVASLSEASVSWDQRRDHHLCGKWFGSVGLLWWSFAEKPWERMASGVCCPKDHGAAGELFDARLGQVSASFVVLCV